MIKFLIVLLPFSEAYQCGDAIRRSLAGPDDWTKIIGSGNEYSDTTMPADRSMVVWPGFERSDHASLKKYLGYIRSYKRPTQMESRPSLWGSKIVPHDIYQGSVGDCYMVAVAAALAERPNRIQKVII